MTATPVVFVHGLWLHATSWDPWLELFARAGYDPVAARWPGEHETVAGTRADPDAVADRGIDAVAEHLAGVVAALPAPPVPIGHSFGGMLVEKLLAQGRGRAGVAIDAAEIKGVLPLPLPALRATFPVLRDPANRHRAVSLSADQFHYAFGNAIDRDESDRLYERWAVPAPGRPLFEAAAANLSPHSPAAVDTRNNDRGPLLRLGRAADLLDPVRVPAGEALLDERLQAHTVRLPAAGGHRAEALARYDGVRRQLRDELGIDPGPELGAAQREVLGTGAPMVRAAAARPALNQLPAPIPTARPTRRCARCSGRPTRPTTSGSWPGRSGSWSRRPAPTSARTCWPWSSSWPPAGPRRRWRSRSGTPGPCSPTTSRCCWRPWTPAWCGGRSRGPGWSWRTAAGCGDAGG